MIVTLRDSFSHFATSGFLFAWKAKEVDAVRKMRTTVFSNARMLK